MTAQTATASQVCWHGDGQMPRGHDCGSAADRMLWIYGRCRSGGRWFWAASCSHRQRGRDEELLEHGWADSEDDALGRARNAIECAAAGRPALAILQQRAAYRALKQVNSAKRKARPPSGAAGAGVVEYLYGTVHYWPEMSGEPEVREVVPFRITRKTPKRIYYVRSERHWPGEDPATGYVSRQGLESDTRCGSDACARRGWCEHGDAPGEIRTRNYHDADYHLFATRKAAEEYLFSADRERERQRQEAGPELRRLRMEMANAHPDRGGTNEGFMAARKRYEEALQGSRVA
jgi:hypothetical protein